MFSLAIFYQLLLLDVLSDEWFNGKKTFLRIMKKMPKHLHNSLELPNFATIDY